MENMKCLKKDLTEDFFINDINFDANKHKLSRSSILSVENECLNNEILSQDDDVFLESDEYDYNSDCSLGSMDSVYLRLKDHMTFLNSNRPNNTNKKQSLCRNFNLNVIDDSPKNNIITRKPISDVRKSNGSVKETKSETKLSTILFYGKQVIKESITQNIKTKLFYRHQRKKIHMRSKTIRTTLTLQRFKHRVNKLSISMKNRQHRRHSLIQRILDTKHIHLKDEKLLRNKLKEPIPLLQLKGKIKISQKINKYSNTHKKPSENKKDFIITDCETNYEDYSFSESNSFFIDDFMDSDDDFDCTKETEDIIKTLFDEDDSISDYETYH